MKKYIALTFIFIILSCSSIKKNEGISEKKTYYISLVQLIANPEKYDKKKVKVEGYFYYEHEGNAIYITKTDFDNVLFKNGVYLNISPDLLKNQKIDKPYKGYVSIEGIYNKDNLGGGGLFSGTIENIISINRLFKRDSQTDEYNIQ